LQLQVLFSVQVVMRPTSGARWGTCDAAAGGRRRRCTGTAAVEKIERCRLENFFGKPQGGAYAITLGQSGSNPVPATKKGTCNCKCFFRFILHLH